MEERPVDEFDYGRAVYEPLTQSVRQLIDATIRTEVGEDTVAKVQALVDEGARLLSERLVPESFGVQYTRDGRGMPWGNAIIGLRNPIAPPLAIERNRDGSVWCDVELGAAYEGPPGCLHGGISALILDQLLGATAHRPAQPAFTGTLTVRYQRPTRLGRVHGEARVVRHDGVKTYAVGHLENGEGIMVVAEGVFVRPAGRA